MPKGDPGRTWFPEMIDRLRLEWHQEMAIPPLIALRDELDGMLQQIRSSRKIQTPIFTCKKCGKTGHGAQPHVSVRALILALGRFGIASRNQTRAMEKKWAAYRTQHQLDIEGKTSVKAVAGCPPEDAVV